MNLKHFINILLVTPPSIFNKYHSLYNSKQCKNNVLFYPLALSHISSLPVEILKSMLWKPKAIFWKEKQNPCLLHGKEAIPLEINPLTHASWVISSEAPVKKQPFLCQSPSETWFISHGSTGLLHRTSKGLVTRLSKTSLAKNSSFETLSHHVMGTFYQ